MGDIFNLFCSGITIVHTRAMCLSPSHPDPFIIILHAHQVRWASFPSDIHLVHPYITQPPIEYL